MDDNSQIEHRSRLEPIKRRGQYPVLRNWLNAIFMIGALIGVAVFYWSDNTVFPSRYPFLAVHGAKHLGQ